MPPILHSLLDTDAYKLHMQQAVFHRYPDAEVVAEFHSRNEEDLLPMMGQIEEQLRLAGSLRLTRSELDFLAERPFFTPTIWTTCAASRWMPPCSRCSSRMAASMCGSKGPGRT
jgi:nicotinic acid phosphoribosyltransferase